MCAIYFHLFSYNSLFFNDNLCNYTISFTAMHIVSKLFIIISLNSTPCDVLDHFYTSIFVSLESHYDLP